MKTFMIGAAFPLLSGLILKLKSKELAIAMLMGGLVNSAAVHYMEIDTPKDLTLFGIVVSLAMTFIRVLSKTTPKGFNQVPLGFILVITLFLNVIQHYIVTHNLNKYFKVY